jgi:hypothetical protein
MVAILVGEALEDHRDVNRLRCVAVRVVPDLQLLKRRSGLRAAVAGCEWGRGVMRLSMHRSGCMIHSPTGGLALLGLEREQDGLSRTSRAPRPSGASMKSISRGVPVLSVNRTIPVFGVWSSIVAIFGRPASRVAARVTDWALPSKSMSCS